MTKMAMYAHPINTPTRNTLYKTWSKKLTTAEAIVTTPINKYNTNGTSRQAGIKIPNA
jgi:hypothetical protein